jgi:nucleoside-diphosphate-sugar epimerase
MTIGSILITGGSSLVGSAIIRQTKIESKYSPVHPIVAFSRNVKPESSASLIHYVRGNVYDELSLQSVLRSNPHIVHTVNDDYDESAILVANALANKSEINKERRSFIFFSVAVGFPSLIFNTSFVESKRQAESALLGIKLKNQIRVVVFRPGKERCNTCKKTQSITHFYFLRHYIFIS